MEVASSDCVTSVNSDDLFVFRSFSSCFVCSFSLSLERQNKSKTNDERGFWCDNVSHRGRRIGADPTPIGATVGGFFFFFFWFFSFLIHSILITKTIPLIAAYSHVPLSKFAVTSMMMGVSTPISPLEHRIILRNPSNGNRILRDNENDHRFAAIFDFKMAAFRSFHPVFFSDIDNGRFSFHPSILLAKKNTRKYDGKKTAIKIRPKKLIKNSHGNAPQVNAGFVARVPFFFFAPFLLLNRYHRNRWWTRHSIWPGAMDFGGQMNSVAEIHETSEKDSTVYLKLDQSI